MRAYEIDAQGRIFPHTCRDQDVFRIDPRCDGCRELFFQGLAAAEKPGSDEDGDAVGREPSEDRRAATAEEATNTESEAK